MATTNYLRSEADASVREDVLSLIETLTAQENQFLAGLGKATAINTVHSVLTDTLRTAASAAVEEGIDATLLARTTPARVTNIVQTVAIPFAVTGIQEAVDHYQGENELVRQTRKAMADWGNAAEFDIVRGTVASGASGTAAKLKGIVSAVSTNNTLQTSGTVLNASHIMGILQDVYDNGNGEMVTDLFVGGIMKRRISSFTTSNTKYVDATSKVAVDSVDVYETDFGRLRIHLHRFVQQSTDANARLLGVNMDKWKLAYLRKPFIQELARAGDASKRQVIGDLTVEARNEKVNFFMDGFLKAS
jgi:hypothetical protein